MINLFDKDKLQSLHQQIDTPALIVHEGRLLANIRQMQSLADSNNSALRPHTKTHKSVYLAQLQLKAGAKGITVAKLSEAEIMFRSGVNDIFIANQITHPLKLKRLRELRQKAKVIIGLDDPRQIKLLEQAFKNEKTLLPVRIEINSGLNRCGVKADQSLVDLAKKVVKSPCLKLEGLFTHAGHVYAAKSDGEVAEIGRREGEIMTKARNLLKESGIVVNTISVGSTPTVKYSVQNPQVTEIRPGNYVFYDAMQINLGSATVDQCSLFVLSIVVSRPERNRIVIDAGSKALHTDGANMTGAFGLPFNVSGKIVRLSEEHGILEVAESCAVRIGDPVLIVPNHACAAVNLFDYYYFVDENLKIRQIAIDARGKSQ